MTVRGLLEGKVAIVTGAGRGIGAAAAREFAAEGARVVLAARSADEVDAVAASITNSGGQAVGVPADVTDEGQVERVVRAALVTFGRLDVAFNNAGAGHMPRPLAEISIEEFEASIRVNLVGVFLTMKHEIPAMVANGGGAIVNMSSSAGLQGVLGLGDYSAAKHGVIGLTKSAALDYGHLNVRVNAIAPGPIVTDQLARLPEETRAQIAKSVPIGRLGDPEQVVRIAVWLCSDQSWFVHGAVLPVDGGRLAGAMGKA